MDMLVTYTADNKRLLKIRRTIQKDQQSLTILKHLQRTLPLCLTGDCIRGQFV